MFENTFYTLGAVPFIILGFLHTLYSVMDDQNPTKIVPRKQSAIKAMKESTLTLTKDTTVWKAWIGFNISHGLGVMLFGGFYFYLSAFHYQTLLGLGPLPWLAPIIAAIYFILAHRYWFKVPAAGSALGFILFTIGLFL